MPTKPNHVYTINFTVKTSDGTVMDSTENHEPFSYVAGTDSVLPKLEEEVGNMLISSKKTVTMAPEDGYGSYVEEAVQVAKRENFPEDADLKPGMEFVATGPEGEQMPFHILKVDEEGVTIDFNHPLAGETLTFDVELLDVRPATPEELSHGHVHGVGGHHH